MANNYLQFSFNVECDRASREWLDALLKDDDRLEGILVSGGGISYELTDDGIWFFDEEYGSPSDVAAVLQAWLKAFDLDKRIVFSWAVFCSKLRLDEFGGGSVLVAKDKIFWSHDLDADGLVLHNAAPDLLKALEAWAYAEADPEAARRKGYDETARFMRNKVLHELGSPAVSPKPSRREEMWIAETVRTQSPGDGQKEGDHEQ